MRLIQHHQSLIHVRQGGPQQIFGFLQRSNAFEFSKDARWSIFLPDIIGSRINPPVFWERFLEDLGAG